MPQALPFVSLAPVELLWWDKKKRHGFLLHRATCIASSDRTFGF